MSQEEEKYDKIAPINETMPEVEPEYLPDPQPSSSNHIRVKLIVRKDV